MNAINLLFDATLLYDEISSSASGRPTLNGARSAFTAAHARLTTFSPFYPTPLPASLAPHHIHRRASTLLRGACGFDRAEAAF